MVSFVGNCSHYKCGYNTAEATFGCSTCKCFKEACLSGASCLVESGVILVHYMERQRRSSLYRYGCQINRPS
eukprot:XP_001709032.1 Hypothetical protein GL50803_8229 [Giardia lamblia ATCC 50803]